MDPTEKVNNLINCLTKNEDERQELWVSYLSGTPIELFESRLERIRIEYHHDVYLRKVIWQLLNCPISEQLQSVLNHNFTDYERSIICFLMLGLNVSQISDIKDISEVRIRQSLVTIRYNKSWEVIYGIKKTSY